MLSSVISVGGKRRLVPSRKVSEGFGRGSNSSAIVVGKERMSCRGRGGGKVDRDRGEVC